MEPTLQGFLDFHGKIVEKHYNDYLLSLNIEKYEKKNDTSSLLNDLSKVIQCTNTCKKIEIDDIKGYLCHKGPPPGLHECSKCREHKDNTHFKYYQQRVDNKGYLMRTNALCNLCSIKNKKEKDETMKKDKNKIPKKPEPGSMCPNCKRSWGTKENPRNWHKDHDAIKHEFRGWLCGHCNMSKSDHRNGIS
jgi:hypothetical protein